MDAVGEARGERAAVTVAASTARTRIGWSLLGLIAAYVVIAALLIALPGRPAEGDLDGIGTTWEALETDAPELAELISRNLRTLGIASLGFALFALAIVMRGYRYPARWLWVAAGILPLTMGLLAVHFLMSGAGGLAAFYAVVTIVGVAGMVLAAPGR